MVLAPSGPLSLLLQVRIGKLSQILFKISHNLIQIFKTQDIQPIGAIILTNHKVDRLGVEAGSRPYAFAIETEEGTKVKLAGDTEEAASRWIAVISHAAQQSDLWLDTR